ncbi:hypothetical protein BDV28DRAFT_65137 [Aspergillus coremiiformis]|uniref:F-box domain-containing protein n=1 Tax=Aspergillus coremiiformis TaxID=138285 RepID=A0A5N6ZGJ1_9EURO|nr:hypothetical protein BDV28DRAFT_65137 [Aspergillus coremiiformis]
MFRKNKNNTLCSMPTELVEHIAKFLDLLDDNQSSLCNFRLTCMDLYEKMLHHFGHTVLHTVYTDFSFSNIRKLIRLSEDVYLREFVHCLSLVQRPTKQMGNGFAWIRDTSGKLDMDSLGPQWLLRALRLFPNCRSFVVQLNYAGECPSRIIFGPTDGITVLLDVIAKAGISVKSFGAHSQPGISSFAFSNLDPHHIDLSILDNPAFKKAWEHVEQLEFDHNLIPERIAEWVFRLIVHAPRLKILEMGFDYAVQAQSVISRLANGPVPELEELTLRHAMELKWRELQPILQASRRTLRVLKLQQIQLSKGSWVDVLMTLREFPALEEISLAWLSTDPAKVLNFPTIRDALAGLTMTRPIQLGAKHCRGVRKNVMAAYQGPLMSETLDTLLASARED